MVCIHTVKIRSKVLYKIFFILLQQVTLDFDILDLTLFCQFCVNPRILQIIVLKLQIEFLNFKSKNSCVFYMHYNLELNCIKQS